MRRCSLFSTAAALLLIAAVSGAQAMDMYVPMGAYCDTQSLGVTVLAAGNTLLVRMQKSYNQNMVLLNHTVTGTGNVTTVVLSDYETSWSSTRVQSMRWDAVSKSLLLQGVYNVDSGDDMPIQANLTACTSGATSSYLAAGAYCSSYATIVASADLALVMTSDSTIKCGTTYDLTSTDTPFNYYPKYSTTGGSCSSLTDYAKWDSTNNALFVRGSVTSNTLPSTARVSVALTAGTCTANATVVPTNTAFCATGAGTSISMWQSSVLAFDSNGFFAWVPKPGSQECIRVGMYGIAGNSVDLITLTDNCYSGYARPTGMLYNAATKTFTLRDDNDNAFTMGVCAQTADPVISQGYTCGGSNASLLVTGTSFILRPDINSNSGTNAWNMDCLVAGTFSSSTTSGTATITSMDTTCANQPSSSSIMLGQTADKSGVWFVMTRGMPEGYTFAASLCSANATYAAKAQYELAVPSSSGSVTGGPSGPLVVGEGGNMTWILNGSYATDSCFASSYSNPVAFFTGWLGMRGTTAYYVLTGMSRSCTFQFWVYDLTMSAGQLSLFAGRSMSTTAKVTTTTPAAAAWNGIYCGVPGETLTVVGNSYVWRDAVSTVVGGIWGAGDSVMADVEGMSPSGQGAAQVLNVMYTASSKMFVVSLLGGALKSVSQGQCTGATWSVPTTASYCASNVFGSELVVATALGAFSVSLNDGKKQCILSGSLAVGPAGVSTTAAMATPGNCPSQLGIFALSFTATGVSVTLNNGTTSVTPTTAACPTVTIPQGLYCGVNSSTIVGQMAGSPDTMRVMIAGNTLSMAVASYTLTANFTVAAATGAITLGDFGPYAVPGFSFGAQMSGATVSGLWMWNNAGTTSMSSFLYLSQSQCTNTVPTTMNTVMGSAAVDALDKAVPVLVLEYQTYVLYFPNMTNPGANDCFVTGRYGIANGFISGDATVSGCNMSLTSMSISATNDVTVNLVYVGKAVSFVVNAGGCVATGAMKPGRQCDLVTGVPMYTCNDRFFTFEPGMIASENPNMVFAVLRSVGNLTLATNGTVVSWRLPKSPAVPNTRNYATLNMASGSLMWKSTIYNNAVYVNGACNTSLTSPAMMLAATQAKAGTQWVPVGPYCGTRASTTATDSAIMTAYPWVAKMTFISMPGNTFYMNFTSPDTAVACTTSGMVTGVAPTGEVSLSFVTGDSSTSSLCYASNGIAITRFETATFTGGVLSFGVHVFVGGAATGTMYTYQLGGATCKTRINAATQVVNAGMLISSSLLKPKTTMIQQGTFTGMAPWLWFTLVTIEDTYALSMMQSGSSNAMLSAGTYKNQSNVLFLTTMQQSSIGGGYVNLNTTNIYENWYAPHLYGSFGAGWRVSTILGFQGQSASLVAGNAAGDSSSESDDNSKKIIIAVIIVVAIAAVVGVVVMLRRGGSARSTGQSEGENYQSMNSNKV